MYFVLDFKVKIDFSTFEIKYSFKCLKVLKVSKIFQRFNKERKRTFC